MVYKVSKGGVRSGNTLRGLHSLRARRYAGQACILGRSNLPGKDVQRLLDDSTDDAAVINALNNTDVLLSLNKKQRWGLPATVTHLIRSGRFSSSKTTVSLLERHKLKKRANCVGFFCNKRTRFTNEAIGEKSSSANQGADFQGQKKYFSFNLDHFDSEESRRQFRRRKAEELMQIYLENRRKAKKDKRKDMKSVIVTTVAGMIPKKEVEKLLSGDDAKPEYKLEVFYPCPQSCSLTFNPKYTDVTMTQNDDGEMEVMSNKKPQQKSRQRKHRKRLNMSDVNTFNTEALTFEQDVEEMWEEEYKDEEKSNTNVIYDANDSADSQGNPEMQLVDESNTKQVHILDSILASLVENAERVKAQWNSIKSLKQHRKKCHNKQTGQAKRFGLIGTELSKKSHVIRVDTFEDHTNAKESNHTVTELTTQPIHNIKCPTIPFVIPKMDVHPNKLAEDFGADYAEARCQPRRFCINVTDKVITLFSSTKADINESAFTTYLVFVSEGCFDNGMERFNVTLNCAGCPNPEDISFAKPCEQITVNSIMNSFINILLDLKEMGKLRFHQNTPAVNKNRSVQFQDKLVEKMKFKVDTFFTRNELNRVIRTGQLHEMETPEDNDLNERLMNLMRDSETDIFCEICYDNINHTQLDASTGMQLNPCGHQFCETCWRAHLRTRLREGAVRMICPGYECDAQLGVSTLLSLLHVTEVAQILQRACEEELETCDNAKWCPNPTCGRIIKITNQREESESFAMGENEVLDVACACGERWCFNCLEPAHWPARCYQARDYLDKVSTLKPIKETVDDHDDKKTNQPTIPPPVKAKQKDEYYEVEGRLCPRCRRFIEKNGGCPYMQCKCGHQFCWKCMEPTSRHLSFICLPKANVLYELSRRVKVRHVRVPQTTLEDQKKTEADTNPSVDAKLRGRAQKASMYQRALQQRTKAVNVGVPEAAAQELCKRITKVAALDANFKREVLLQCGVRPADIPESQAELDRYPMATSVTKYLQSCHDATTSLRHVIEFTYVLLQDCPSSQEKRRASRIASDLSGFCSFTASILQAGAGTKQDARASLRRLADIQTWSGRALDALLRTVNRLNRSSR